MPFEKVRKPLQILLVMISIHILFLIEDKIWETYN